MFTDYVLNGQGFGEIGAALGEMRFDPGLNRPYLDSQDILCVTVNSGRMKYDKKLDKLVPHQVKMTVTEAVNRNLVNPMVVNATTMRKDDWLMMDRAVQKAARQRLRAYADLRSANTFSVPGMSKLVLEHERMTDTQEAVVDMDGIAEATADQTHFQLEGLPLPITSSAFHFSERRIAVSRNSGTPIDTTQAEQAGRRIAEKIEQTLIGVVTGMQYGDSNAAFPYSVGGSGTAAKVYGYTNHPDRITKTDITTPTATNSTTTLAEVLAMRDLAYAQNFYGPFMLYHSNDWDQFLDNDYGKTDGTPGANAAYGFAPSQTLRQRLRNIDGITDVRRLDFFEPTLAHQLLLVQMTSDVVRAVNGMEITTMKWPTVGGMQQNFKVMTIQVPQIRSQFIGSSQTTSACGIVHGTTS
jgi:hypothetical protein